MEDLARDLADRLGVTETEARRFLQEACSSMKDSLRDGRTVELGDLLSLAISGRPELREDESGGFSAYAPKIRGLAAQPLGALKSELDKPCHSAIYYVAKGDAELENESLETALEAYTAAVEANPMHESAEGNRLQAAKLIKERDSRMEVNQGLVERAEALTSMADEEALKGRSAEAIDLLREAENVYMEVTDEFPLEAKLRDRGVNQLRHRVQELKQQIMVNAADFSGSGQVHDVRELVDTYGSGMDEAGLKAILRRSYDQEYARLESELSEAMRVQ